MSKALWTKVDGYYESLFLNADPALESALRVSEQEGLDPIAVSPVQGQFLYQMVRLRGASRVLELGTLGGYSTICMARALPVAGRLITLELSDRNAGVARRNIDHAGVGERVEIRVGPALESLKAMVAEGEAPFDFVFIDANKDGYPDYFDQVMRLVEKGSVIIADNVVREGAVVDAASTDPYVQGVRAFNERVAADSRVVATALQTVGSKGYDGFAVVVVIE